MKALVKSTMEEIDVVADPHSTVFNQKFYNFDRPEEEYTADELIFIKDYYGN